jgi:ubiquinone/menaquinone biosynthesis C-methylase UbiE
MGRLLNLVTPLHTRTKRDYLARMVDNKLEAVAKAKQYGFDYWDGERRYGYGGYKYDGRWKTVAEQLIGVYELKPGAKILDIGCGKAFLLYELMRLLPNAEITGFDASEYAIAHAKEEIRDRLFVYKAQDPYPFGDQHFDLAISLGCFHNLRLFALRTALAEMARVAKNQYVLVESYRNEAELFNLQCWALTCESFFDTAEWVWLYQHFGYTGDYEFIYFE